MHSVTSNAVKQTVTPIAEVASVSMYPRHEANGRTTSEFLNMIADQDNQTSPACCGSENITDGPWGNAWYNYLYIPHRTGIGGDNYQYGTLVVFGMTVNTGSIAIKHLIAGVWQGWIIN